MHFLCGYYQEPQVGSDETNIVMLEESEEAWRDCDILWLRDRRVRYLTRLVQQIHKKLDCPAAMMWSSLVGLGAHVLDAGAVRHFRCLLDIPIPEMISRAVFLEINRIVIVVKDNIGRG